MAPERGEGPRVDRRTEIERAIECRVRGRFAEWFPQAPDSAAVRVRQLSDRRRSRVYSVTVGDSAAAPQIVAKVRLGPSTGSVLAGARPTLATGALPEEQLARLEHDGLSSIWSVFGSAGTEFAAIRPLDLVPEHNIVLMDYVEGRTLRDAVVSQSRLHPRRTRTEMSPVDVWHRAGSWLRTFRSAVPPGDRPVRQSTSDEVVGQFCALRDHVSGRGGPRSFTRLADLGARLAEDALPGRLPLTVGHGDFAPRNILVRTDSRVVVFDPLFRWAVPVQEDLCRLLVGLRLLGLQVHTHGLALDQRRIERWEAEALQGCFDGQMASSEFRAYQLLILLDKWSALLEGPTGLAGRVRRSTVRAADRFLEGQGTRLLQLALS